MTSDDQSYAPRYTEPDQPSNSADRRIPRQDWEKQQRLEAEKYHSERSEPSTPGPIGWQPEQAQSQQAQSRQHPVKEFSYGASQTRRSDTIKHSPPERQPTAKPSKQKASKTQLPLVGALAVFLLLGLSVGAYFLLTSLWAGDEAEMPTLPLTPTSSVAISADPDTELAATVAPSDTNATSPQTTAAAASSATAATVQGIIAGDEVLLEGAVSSEQVADSLMKLVEPMVGSGGVINQLSIDPTQGALKRLSIVVDDAVLFSAGSDVISPQFFPLLDQIVAMMQLNPNITVVVEGHTDSSGDEVENLALSQRRAEAVVNYIAENNVNRFRIEPRGRGSGEPISENDSDDGRQRNRRIEFNIEGFELDGEG